MNYLSAFARQGLFVLILFSACQSPKPAKPEELGEIHFTVAGNPESLVHFNRGMLLLHSFEYVDAAEAFSEARKSDPSCVMAYWGEAMTCNHPLWREQDYEKGNAILSKLGPDAATRSSKANSPLEKDFLEGIQILFGKGNKAERDSAYARFMETLYSKYPGNDEVTAFYSLALNGWGTTAGDLKIFEKAASMAVEVIGRNPKHPGALHYLIHAYDHPAYAGKALATAQRYAIVAPAAGHALHMPTHTYLALGLWDKVVSSNEVSWAAEVARKERKKLDNDALGYHSYHWLQYGCLQLGNADRAAKMADSMYQYCLQKPSPKARAHTIYLKTSYLAETNDFESSVAKITVEQADLNIATRAASHFADGMKAYHKQDEPALHSIIQKMTGERLTDAERAADNGIRVCGSINRSIPTKNDIQYAEVMELELRAMQAWMKKNAANTEHFLKQATILEGSSQYAYGPPDVPKPSWEMYAEWLLENNRPEEAMEQFERSLKSAPNKRLSVAGKEKAMKLVAQNKLARQDMRAPAAKS